MSRSTFSGPVVSQAGFITGTDAVLPAVTASTLTIPAAVQDNSEVYNGAVIQLNRAAGQTITLPAATGSQAMYRFVLTGAVTSNSTIIKVANSTDVLNGTASIGGATGAAFSTLPASDTITLNGSTTGGLAGSYVWVWDIAPGFWITEAELIGSGTPATPFSATV